MNDRESIDLLDALLVYFTEYGHDLPSPEVFTVSDLARDLIDSLDTRQREFTLGHRDYSILTPTGNTKEV